MNGPHLRAGTPNVVVETSATSPRSVDHEERPPVDSLYGGPGPIDPEPTPEVRLAGDQIRVAAQLRRWGLALADTLAIAVGVVVSFLLEEANPGTQAWAILLVPIWIVTAKLYGLYDNDDRRLAHHTSRELPSLVATAAVSVAVWKALTMLLGATPPISSASVLAIGVIAGMSSLLLRSGVRAVWRFRAPPDRTLIIGSSAKAAMVSSRLDRHRQQGGNIEVIGFVSDRAEDGDAIPDELSDRPFLGGISELPTVFERERITRVIITKEPASSGRLGEIIDTCLEKDVAATLVPIESEVLGPAAEISRLADVPVIEFHSFAIPRSTRFMKRMLDIFVSALLLIPALPILLVSVIAIRLTSKGPAFFLHERVGLEGRHFDVIKLRTMYEGSEGRLEEMLERTSEVDPSYKVPDDPRVTPVGRFLRATSIDELPQLINVLKGDMSLVGPRPKIPHEATLYEDRESRYLKIRPGLTGPMQVSGRGLLTFEERLALERDYLESISLARDIEILLKTPGAVIAGRGARNL